MCFKRVLCKLELFCPLLVLNFSLLNFSVCIRVQPINNVVILTVSGGQQRNSAMHEHVSILLQTPLPSRLPCNIEQSSLCYTVGLYWLSILNIAQCTCPSQTPYLFPLIMLYFYIWQTKLKFIDFLSN